MNYKKFTIIVFSTLVIGLILVGSTVAYVDPFFHYHKPRPEFFYTLKSERYQNDGILRHFNYDAIITGTSMTQNFKTSEFNALFKVDSIKVPYSGARFKETNDALKVAYKSGKKLKYIVRSLDMYSIIADKNSSREDLGSYPIYLYNDCMLDDVKYLLNKDAFFRHTVRILKDKLNNKKPGITSFDEYNNWNAEYQFGRDAVLKNQKEYISPNMQVAFSALDREIAVDNIRENVVDLALLHPETTFYYFFPPYSVVWWRNQFADGQLERSLEAEKLAIEMILECPNIKLYSFNLMSDITTNLDNYKDTTHYGEWINSDILRYMKEEKGLLTKGNYKEYLIKERELYMNYPYDSI